MPKPSWTSGDQPGSQPVSRETLSRIKLCRTSLDRYVDLLGLWNRRLNLVRVSNVGELWERHILDAAQLLDHVKLETRCAIDIGSGAGFPGIILAILSGIPWVLVEADRRKAAFLREAIRVTAAPGRAIAQRAETLQLTTELVTARAVAPLNDLLALASPLLSPTGYCLFLKGRSASDEVAAAGRDWHMDVRQTPSATASDASVLRISALRRR